MADAVSFIVLLWLVAETNFFFRRKPQTAADFENTPEQEKERTDALQQAEAAYQRLDQEWEKLQPLIARAKRKKDGNFDRRSKLGKMLSRIDLHGLKQARKTALKERRSAEIRFLRYEREPTRRRNRWIRAESFRGACRHSLRVLLLEPRGGAPLVLAHRAVLGQSAAHHRLPQKAHRTQLGVTDLLQ